MVINQGNYRLQHVTTFGQNENYFKIVISRSVQGLFKYAVFDSRSHLGDAHTEALVDNWELY